MEKIKVWFHNNLNNEWFKLATEHYKETNDEYKYFRVISYSEKNYYSSFEDYYRHNYDFIDQQFISDVNGKVLLQIT